MIRFCSLGSGSSGNALVVEIGATRLLVDCGFSMQELERRLSRVDLTPQDLTAVLVTHEHADHIGATAPLSRRYGLTVFTSPGTRLAARDTGFAHIQEIQADAPLEIDDAWVQPYTVPHDSREPIQFAFSDGDHRLVLMTDAGHISPHMVDVANAAEALLLECNHDPAMLAAGRYPASLKRRIAGGYGHLPNHAATDLLHRIDRSRLRHVIGMHLSSDNNHETLARQALAEGLGSSPSDPEIATQDYGFTWRTTAQA
ncbi:MULTISPECIES: MBL fold metallo-hydrolase [unclassified Thioalkalivibrio]|uniref:MBL fold metallo-hydrolase n=1 Tax=unclassified Thioalkalivibrio TaxID=2621013 RepID=UPI00035C1B29|nr:MULTISPECIES: MBL fold metallo-hydrolase [unclassified Thioalkalivibrio]